MTGKEDDPGEIITVNEPGDDKHPDDHTEIVILGSRLWLPDRRYGFYERVYTIITVKGDTDFGIYYL